MAVDTGVTMADVRVEPALLERAQVVCAEMRDEVTRNSGDAESAMQDGMRGLPGWQTRRTLEDLSWWWRDYASRLGGYLDQFGSALDRTATAYRDADEASRDLFDIRGR
jgi:hypothetical protein